ncbi:hypothetical protein D3C72_1925770 [compost metagenome]
MLAIGRARKADLRGFEVSTRTLIARGAKALSRALFALEGRWVPLDHWLEAELRTLTDSAQAVPLLTEAILSGRHEPLAEALERLQAQLEAEGFPPPAERTAFFLELIHPTRAAERAIHGLN